jgi:hypothetical protein
MTSFEPRDTVHHKIYGDGVIIELVSTLRASKARVRFGVSQGEREVWLDDLTRAPEARPAAVRTFAPFNDHGPRVA